MSKKPKQSELDIIPVLDDVVSLGKVKKPKAAEFDNEVKAEPKFETVKEEPSHIPNDAADIAAIPSPQLSDTQKTDIQTIIDHLINSKLEILHTELSAEISLSIYDYLQSDKSKD